MIKKIFLLTASLSFILLTACGPAAEDRRAMHERAKVFQDSIANVIRATIAEAEGPVQTAAPVAPAPAAAPTPTTK